jgi:hypothetical protein
MAREAAKRRGAGALVLALVVVLAAPAFAQSADAVARYQAMLARVKGGDRDVDFQALRYAYADSGGDRARRREVDDLVGAMFRAYKVRDFDGAIATAEKVLAIDYLDIDAQVVCDLSYRMLSNTIGAESCHEMASRLLRSIADSGDGATPESAYRVIAEREAYSFLNARGLKPVGRRRIAEHGGSVDAFDVADNATGATRTIYFALYRPADAPPR